MKILLSFFLFFVGTLLPLRATNDGEISSVSSQQSFCTVDSMPVLNLAGDSTLVVAKGDCLLQPIELRDSTAGDTLRVLTHSHFSRLSPFWQVAVPVSLSAVGVAGLADRGFLFKGKRKVRQFFNHLRGNSPVRVDDYLQYAPFLWFVGGAEIPGVHHRHNFRDRLLIGATAYAVMGATVNAVKYSIGELRPDHSARNSFPSGHTATAVMGAELVRTEYGNRLGFFAYAGALTVGVLRMYNNRHWFNDVLGGAAFGFAATRIALWLLPYEQRLLGIRPRKGTAVSPPKRSTTAMKVPLLLPAVSPNAAGLTALWLF